MDRAKPSSGMHAYYGSPRWNKKARTPPSRRRVLEHEAEIIQDKIGTERIMPSTNESSVTIDGYPKREKKKTRGRDPRP